MLPFLLGTAPGRTGRLAGRALAVGLFVIGQLAPASPGEDPAFSGAGSAPRMNRPRPCPERAPRNSREKPRAVTAEAGRVPRVTPGEAPPAAGQPARAGNFFAEADGGPSLTRLAVLTELTKPKSIQIWLVGTPKNHRSPPA